MRRHGPEELVAVIEIVGPLAVSKQVGLRDLDLDNREAAFRIDCHEVGAAAIRKRHFAYGEQVLPAEKTRHATRDFGGNWRGVGEATRIGQAGHLGSLEHRENREKKNGRTLVRPFSPQFSS